MAPKALREVLCPDPWSVHGYPGPRIRPQTTLTQRIPSSDLQALDWRKVALPGGVCGSSGPIRSRGDFEVRIHPDANLLWWDPVEVFSWSRPTFGDLDGDGRNEAALGVGCANTGGTADGQLAFSDVIFKAVGKSLRVVSIVTPRQPLDPSVAHVPLLRVQIKPGRVVAQEFWYGPNSSGRARTIWKYMHGTLIPTQTIILQKPS